MSTGLRAGTNNDGYLQVNGTDVLTALSSGRIGIGLTNPFAKLHVNITSPTSVPAAGSNNHPVVIGNVGFGAAIGALNTGESYIQGTRWDGTATNYSLLLNPNGGNVGIGTDSPSELLHLQSGHTKQILKSTNLNTASSVIFDVDDVNTADFLLGQLTGRWNGNDVAYINFEAGSDTTNKDDGVITFLTSASGSSPTEKLRITSSGDVGIGTDNPTSGNAAELARFIHIHNSDTGATSPSEIYFTNNNSGVASNVGGLITFFNSDFYFWNYANNDLIFGTGGAEKLRFDHSENTLDFESTSKIRLKGSVLDGTTHAHLNIGSDASNSETRAIDIYGGWSEGEYKSINYNHGTGTADILAQQRVRYKSSPSSTYYEIGRFYHGQNTTAYPIRFVSTGVTTADLELDGNLKVSSGNGINFSAYATSGNPSSNLLDDYEEGTFLPTMFGSTVAGTSTYGLQYGYYVKVGKLVHFQIRMTVVSSTATGHMRIGGLPFVSLNDTNRGYASVNVSYANNISLPSGSTWMGAYTSAGGSSLVLIGNTPGSVVQQVSVDTSWVALIGGTYIANV